MAPPGRGTPPRSITPAERVERLERPGPRRRATRRPIAASAALGGWLALAASAWGEPDPTGPAADADLLWLGATGALRHDDAGADSAFGAQAAWTRLRRHGRVPVLGVAAGLVRPARPTAARVALEGLAGRRLRPWLALGVGLGPALDLRQNAPARLGVTTSLWLFAGVSPFVRATALTDGTRVLEVGLQIAVPIARL